MKMFLALVSSIGLVFSAGCNQYREAWDGQLPATYVRAGERTEVRLITWEQWPALSTTYGVTLPAQPTPVPFAGESQGRALADEAAGLASQLVGLAVDVVKSEIRKEAERHTASYAASIYAQDYWQPKQVPTYAAFEVVRFTSDFNTEQKPASRLICALVPATNDRRLLFIQPVYYINNAASARVSRDGHGEHRLDVTFKISLSSIAVDDENKVEEVALGNPEFVVGSYDMDKTPAMTASYSQSGWTGPLQHLVAGYAVAPAKINSSYLAAMKELDEAQKDDVAKRAAVDVIDGKLMESLMPEGATQEMVTKLAEAIAKLGDGKDLREIEPFVAGLPDAKARSAARLLLNERGIAIGASTAASKRRNDALAAANGAKGGGVFSIKVSVTEIDKSRVAGDLTYVQEFIGERKQGLQDLVKDAVTNALSKDKKGDK